MMAASPSRRSARRRNRPRCRGGSGPGGPAPVETQLHFTSLSYHRIGPVKRGHLSSRPDSGLQVRIRGESGLFFHSDKRVECYNSSGA